jgi:alcohol dehydrogenase, propanol-preferring
MAIIEREPTHAPAGEPTTMRAAVVESFTAPLALREVPKPVAGPGEIVVKVETSGLCHTDIHAAHGDWPVKPSPPFVPGHEGIGIVESLGEGVTEVAVGDRVAMPWLGYACGTCEYCVSGWETLCLEQKNTGYAIDGGFAEYVKAYGRYVVTVPDDVDPVDAAPLTCAGVTTYKAVKVAGTRPSDIVAIFGIGGLGHMAQQYAQIAGGRTVAVDVVDEKLELARELGATETVLAGRDKIPEGFDHAIECLGRTETIEQAMSAVAPGGTAVLVGMAAPGVRAPLDALRTTTQELTVVGSWYGSLVPPRDLPMLAHLLAFGELRLEPMIARTIALDGIHDALARFETGDEARSVIVYD